MSVKSKFSVLISHALFTFGNSRYIDQNIRENKLPSLGQRKDNCSN